MNGAHAYRAALAQLHLPPAWQVELAIRPRRRHLGIEVKPGGTVAVLIPRTATPEDVARFVGGHLGWITQNVNRAQRLAPNHGVKTFVDGEDFDLLGQRYRLQLVDTLPTGITDLPAAADDHVLYVRRQRPELMRQAIIGLYKHTGLDWVQREGLPYARQNTHSAGVRYEVRDLGRRR